MEVTAGNLGWREDSDLFTGVSRVRSFVFGPLIPAAEADQDTVKAGRKRKVGAHGECRGAVTGGSVEWGRNTPCWSSGWDIDDKLLR